MTNNPIIEMDFQYNNDATELYICISEFEHPNRENRISHNQVCIKGDMIIQFIKSVVIGRKEIHCKFNK